MSPLDFKFQLCCALPGFVPTLQHCRGLVPRFASSDRPANRAEQPEHHSDDHQNAADGVEQGQPGEVTNQQEYHAENDHGAFRSVDAMVRTGRRIAAFVEAQTPAALFPHHNDREIVEFVPPVTTPEPS